MIITKKFINENRTENGGFTRKQLNAIGVNWPPEKGWLEKSIGKSINEDQAKIFTMNNLLENKKKRA